MEPSRFQARGRLVGVDREEGRLVVEIRPNPQGILKEPFRLILHAALALLEELPPGERGVPGGGAEAQEQADGGEEGRACPPLGRLGRGPSTRRCVLACSLRKGKHLL